MITVMTAASVNGQGPPIHKHILYPHHHPPYNDKGELKDCSARFWCPGCKTWLDGKPCHPAKLVKKGT